jgi:prophage regulatory protein
MPTRNDVTSRSAERAPTNRSPRLTPRRKGDDMIRRTGPYDSRQVRGTEPSRKLSEGAQAPPTANAGDPRLDLVPLKLIRFQTVKDRTGLSRSTIWRLERIGAFPKHHRISANAVAWVEHDVADWIRAKAGVR